MLLSLATADAFDDKVFNENKLSVEVDREVFLIIFFVFPAPSVFFLCTAVNYVPFHRLHLYLRANWLTDLELNAALELFLMFAIITVLDASGANTFSL